MNPARALGALRWLGFAALVSMALWPLLPMLSRAWPGFALLGRALEPWFSLHCERDPARTLTLGGTPLAVCARCSGVYWGMGGGALVRRPVLVPARLRLWVGAAAALMLADIVLEDLGLHGAWSTLRVVTGLLLGYPVGVALGAWLAPSRP